MGRTNSTYRNHLEDFINRFKPFRRALRQSNQKHLDSIWEKAHKHSSAAAYMNSSSPGLPAVISIMVGLQRDIEENRQEIKQIKQRLEEEGI